MNPIKFYRGEESSVVHEQYEGRKDSIFAKQYELALNGIERFLGLRKNDTNNKANNIFAFIGDRGMGKTSCMESVANMIPDFRKDKEKFKLIDTVDPSFFDDSRNILEMVIGKMFAEFSQDASNTSTLRSNDYESKKAKLLTSFKEVRHIIAKMESNEVLSERGSITKLQDLAAAGILSNKFHTLVSDYLTYFDSEILILPVDDIDLNTTQADIMVEQLRKYLIQDNVIILMAVKLSQLSLVMEQKFATQYETLRKEQLIEQSSLMDMVIKYLTKLIPLDHRIYMPTMETFFDTELQLYEDKKEGNLPVLSGSNVKYTVTSLIFRKCRYLFYHSKGVTSFVVPTNLRDLRHLIELLYRMRDYRESWDAYNKEIFRNYLFGTWMPDNLDWKGCESINELNSVKDASIFNSMVLSHLQKRFDVLFRAVQTPISRRVPSPLDFSEFDLITSSRNSTYNVSVGDVFVIISLIKQTLNNQEDRVYIFMIETMYSMRLYQYYDEMTDKDNGRDANPVDETIRKAEKIDGLNNYEILTAGSLINVVYYNKLGAEESTKTPRSLRQIYLKALRDTISELKNYEGEWGDKQFRKLNMAEFFALHISHPYYTERGRINSTYRSEKDVYYIKEFGSGKEWAVFNLNAIFTNLCNIKRAYKRVDERLFDLAESKGQSIYNSLFDKVKAERPPVDDSYWELQHNFLSWSLIRNAEILENFSDYQSIVSDRRTSPNNTKTFEEYYRSIAAYKINTYDKEDGKPYTIHFGHLSVLAEALKGMDEDEFNLIFSKISESNPSTGTSFDIDKVMSNFKKGYNYKNMGIRIKLSSLFQKLYEERPELKEKIKDAFAEDSYTFNTIKSTLEQFKSDNNL